MYKCMWFVVGAIVCVLLSGGPAANAETQRDGLAVSPVRSDTKVDAGKTQTAYLTIANLSHSAITVDLTVKNFSVVDYTYDYQFHTVQNSWIHFKQDQVQLSAGESRKVAYDVTVPTRTTPGGYYYALVASTDISQPGTPATVQAASLLYVTVNGQLVRTSVLQNASVPFLVTGSQITYKFDVKDTGNVHFNAYFYGKLEGLFGIGNQPETGTGHLLLPEVTRTESGNIPSPLLPGIYRMTYGYRVDFAPIVVAKTAYIIYVPPWSIAALIFLIFLAQWYWQRRRRHPKES